VHVFSQTWYSWRQIAPEVAKHHTVIAPDLRGAMYYDSPGSDNGSNASLNAEWVRLTNTRTYTINLKNRTVRGANHAYTFTTNYDLGAGRACTSIPAAAQTAPPDIQHRCQDRG
jgi:hypothetical protein